MIAETLDTAMLNIFVAKVSFLKLDLATFLNKISQTHLLLTEVVARGSSVKKVLLKISQNLRENIGARVSSSMVLGLGLY